MMSSAIFIFTVRLEDGEYASVDYLIPDCTYLNSWAQVAARYDPRYGLRLYWNGSQVAKKRVRARGMARGNKPIHLGDAGNEWSRFHGRIDEVRIWEPPAGPRRK